MADSKPNNIDDNSTVGMADPVKAKPRGKAWRVFEAACIAVALLLSGSVALQNTGICMAQMRYWNDSELIAAAVKVNATRSLRNETGRTWSVMNIDGSDDSIAQYLKDNPNCCSVNRWPSYRGLLDVVVGWNVPEVELNYERSAADPRWADEPYYKIFISVSTCGTVMKFNRGIGLSKGAVLTPIPYMKANAT